MLRSGTGFALQRLAPIPRFSSNGGRSSPGCRNITRRMINYGTTDGFTALMHCINTFNWKRHKPELLFGCIAASFMLAYEYHVRGAKAILRYKYNFEEARKEREERKRREELAKTNIDISLC